MLDLDEDVRLVHRDLDGDEPCICAELLPSIVKALDPDPVESVVAERTLEGATYPAQRWHTEKVGRFQGIVLGLKTQKQHTADLRKLARQQLEDFEIVLKELANRQQGDRGM